VCVYKFMYTHISVWIRLRDVGFLNYQVFFAKKTYDCRVFFLGTYLYMGVYMRFIYVHMCIHGI